VVVGVQTHCDAEIHVSPVASLPLEIRTCGILALHHLFFNANKLLPPGGAPLKGGGGAKPHCGAKSTCGSRLAGSALNPLHVGAVRVVRSFPTPGGGLTSAVFTHAVAIIREKFRLFARTFAPARKHDCIGGSILCWVEPDAPERLVTGPRLTHAKKERAPAPSVVPIADTARRLTWLPVK
jgi:hypothetical protein